MICKSCNLKEICKTYEFKVNQTHAELVVSSCKYNDGSITINERYKEMPINENAVANLNYMGQAKPDLKDAEKMILNIPDKPEPIKVQCPTCEGVTYDDDLKVCTKCGKVVCSNCGTAVEGKLLCKECWEKE